MDMTSVSVDIGDKIYHYIDSFIVEKLHVSSNFLHMFSYRLFGSTILQWAAAFAVFALFLFFRRRLTALVQYILNAVAKQIVSSITTPILNVVHKPIKWAILLIGLKLSLAFLTFDTTTEEHITDLFFTMEIILLIWAFFKIIHFMQNNHEKILHKAYDQSVKNFINLAITFLKIAIVTIFAIILLRAWGYNPSTLVASLGLFGMAVALAAQDTTKNIFGAMMIFADKPFRIGDWIKTQSTEGIIEEIGMRSTKIRTFEDAVISVPNGVLANDSIINWTKRSKRRIKMSLTLTYSTTAQQMQEILKELRELLQNDPDVHPDTIFVHFLDFNDSSLGILCYFFTKTVNWGEYMRIRERLNLEFMRIVEQNNASFAFPSRSIYIENEQKQP
jgi:MscS family membrane protein